MYHDNLLRNISKFIVFSFLGCIVKRIIQILTSSLQQTFDIDGSIITFIRLILFVIIAYMAYELILFSYPGEYMNYIIFMYFYLSI